MNKIIAITNQKGGVGKTTSTLGIGASLVKLNKRVLLIDYDPQGNLTKALGNAQPDLLKNTISDIMTNEILNKPMQIKTYIRTHNEGFDYIPGNINLAGMELTLINVISREKVLSRVISKLKKDYEFVLIDCMPSLGILSVNALSAANEVIIPVQAEFLSTDGLNQLLRSIMTVKKNLNPKLKVEGILITMTDKRTNLSKIIERKIHEEFGEKFSVYKRPIPRNVKVAESSVFGKSIIDYDSKGKASLAYMKVAKEVIYNAEKSTRKHADREYR